jgi:spermidine synthase
VPIRAISSRKGGAPDIYSTREYPRAVHGSASGRRPVNQRVLLEAGACAAFFVSGAAALAFETLWFEQAGLAFGNDVWASSCVLSAFMLGMAAGHLGAARFAGRLRGLRTFALLEAIAAVSGVSLVFGLGLIESSFASAASGLFERPMLLNGVRIFGAFVLLLVPSAAMGASLPALTAALTRMDAAYGRVLGLLYGANTAGGVIGVVATESLFIPSFGVRTSGLFAGGAELAVAGAAIYMASRSEGVAAVAEEKSVVDRHRMPWFACTFLAGFCLLGLEVVWVRVLTLFVDDTSSAFAAILAVVLSGIALGGFAGGIWLGRAPGAYAQAPRAAYLCGLSGVGGYLIYRSALERFYVPESPPLRVALIAAPLVLPVAVGSGVLFALTGAGIRRTLDSGAVATGQLAAVNTVGAGLGSLAAGFVLLPRLGMERSLFGLLAAYGVIGLVVSYRASESRVTRWVELAAFAVFMAFFPFGRIRNTFIEASAARWMRNTGHIVQIREAKAGTIVHIRHEVGGGPVCDQVVTNAYSMTANDFIARRYMKFFVYLPVAVHPHVSRALLLGYGIGSTARALADTKELEHIDVVDTSEEMLEMSRRVLPEGSPHPLDDPRVRVHLGDARYFLQSTEARFDLITGEPPPPVMAHVASLYTEEYFGLLRERLADGGIVTYWLPTMNLGGPAIRSLIRGFCNAFSNCTLWNGAKENFVLVGFREPFDTASDARFVAQWKTPEVVGELREVGFEFPGQLGATFVGDSEYLRATTEEAQPLTDDFPKLILVKGKDDKAALVKEWRDTRANRERFRSSAFVARMFPPGARRQIEKHFENQRLVSDLMFPGAAGARQVPVLDQVLYQTPLRLPVLMLLGSDPDVQRALSTVTPEKRNAPALLRHETARYLVARDAKGALDSLRRTAESAEAIPGLRAYVEKVASEADGVTAP